VQHLLFPFAVSLNMLNLKIWGIRHLVSELKGPRRWRRDLWADIGCVSTHFAVLVGVPAFFWPLWQVIALFLLREALHDYTMFAAAAPAHFPAEAKFVKADAHGPGVIAGQIYTTVNYRTGGRLACLGGEYQSSARSCLFCRALVKLRALGRPAKLLRLRAAGSWGGGIVTPGAPSSCDISATTPGNREARVLKRTELLMLKRA
jgi:hypothetical protein